MPQCRVHRKTYPSPNPRARIMWGPSWPIRTSSASQVSQFSAPCQTVEVAGSCASVGAPSLPPCSSEWPAWRVVGGPTHRVPSSGLWAPLPHLLPPSAHICPTKVSAAWFSPFYIVQAKRWLMKRWPLWVLCTFDQGESVAQKCPLCLPFSHPSCQPSPADNVRVWVWALSLPGSRGLVPAEQVRFCLTVLRAMERTQHRDLQESCRLCYKCPAQPWDTSRPFPKRNQGGSPFLKYVCDLSSQLWH